jgi:D-3-phosphoglycerate dehydrogenase / 2-oxoglutarate reductase
MSTYKVAILDTLYMSYGEEEEVLARIDAEVVTTRGDDIDQVRALVRDADGLLANLNPVDAETIGAMGRCKVISRYGVGFDSVDVDAATEAGIWVTNVPDYATEDVSDHAVALLLTCVRKIPFRDAGIRKGGWNLKNEQKSWRTADKTLGILGLGHIGSATARKLSGFGFSRVLACDPYIDASGFAKSNAQSVDFETLLAESDLISIHTPLNEETRHLIDARALSLMKKSAILVNTSRGGVIDTKAIVDALKDGGLAYAGLDVHEDEPLLPGSALYDLDNVVLTDHCAWYTEESIVELKTRAAENVAAVLKGERPRTPVNVLKA